jgi:hypothetical protein
MFLGWLCGLAVAIALDLIVTSAVHMSDGAAFAFGLCTGLVCTTVGMALGES